MSKRRNIWLIVVSLVMVLLSSCTTTKYIPVETIKTEYVYKTDSVLMHDSIHVHDSVFIHSKGDTVWYEKWHTKYVDVIKEVVKVDSFIKTDSIQVPYPVEKKLSKWEQTKLNWGGEAILGMIVVFFIIIWLIISRLKR